MCVEDGQSRSSAHCRVVQIVWSGPSYWFLWASLEKGATPTNLNEEPDTTLYCAQLLLWPSSTQTYVTILTCASAALLIIFSKAPFMNEHFEFTKSSAHTISSSLDSCRPYLSLAWSCERVTWLRLLSDYLRPRSPSPIGSLQGWAKLPLPGCENAAGKLQGNCTSSNSRNKI